MANKIEMSLDDIIKSQPGNGMVRNVRESGSGRGRHNDRRQNHRQHFPRGGGDGVLKGGIRGGIQRSKHRREDSGLIHVETRYFQCIKLRLGNLGPNVSEANIRDLFVDFGALKSVVVHYDRSGKTLGTADVEYEWRDDAIKAMKQYNGVPLEGRPMTIEQAIMAVPMFYSHNGSNPVRQPYDGGRRHNPPKHHGDERISRARRQNNHNDYKSSGRQANHNRQQFYYNDKPAPKERKAMTAEELDAELDAYMMEVCEE